jgi:H+-translocating NAD(P) transhydrogenase subunit alpha
MRIGVPQETAEGERRVSLVPDVVKALTAKEIEVAVEPGAGEGSSHSDEEYSEAGAKVGDDAWGADVVLKVDPPTDEEVGRLRQGQVLIAFLEPLTNPDLARSLADKGVTSFAMESIPRITRAQSMDALSSQANLGGYMSVLIAARESGKLFPMMTTAAGTIPPAKVLVLGAGVAGLQAIATAKRLGAVVTGFDVRSVVKEQVQSLGGRFLEVEAVKDAEGEGGYARPLTDEEQNRLRDELAEAAKRQDVIITTAQIPGRPAPLLITGDAVRSMQPGSVIIDLAAETGGNVEGSKPGETVEVDGVKIIGPANLPSQMAPNASALYAKNLQNLVELMIDDEHNLKLDMDDEIVAGACLTKDGEIVNEGAKEAGDIRGRAVAEGEARPVSGSGAEGGSS